MTRPKSSTATWLHVADTSSMSWSTSTTIAPGALGDLPDDVAEHAGLVVGQPGGGLVEQHEPRFADDGAGDLDQAALGGAERADLVDGSSGRARRTRRRR